MNDNHNRLLQELASLMRDKEVYANLDENTKQRAELLIYKAGNLIVEELWEPDQKLFEERKLSEDLSLQFQNIVIKDKKAEKHQPKNKFSLDLPNGLPSNKKYSFQKANCKKSRINSNSSQKGMSRGKDKALKEVDNYNSQIITKIHSRDKYHSKEKIKPGKNHGNHPNTLRDNSQLRRLKTEKENVSASSQSRRERLQTQTSVRKNAHESKKSGQEILKKLAAIDPNPFFTSASSRKKGEKSLQKDIRSLKSIEHQQQQLIKEKQMLSEIVKELKTQILAEKSRLKQSNSHIVYLQKTIGKLEESQREKKIEVSPSNHEFKKKSIKVNEESSQIIEVVSEQKTLIAMYNTVIEEINSQLHIERTIRNDLNKEVILLKNQEQMLASHLQQKQCQSDELFQKLTTLVRDLK